MDSLDDIRWRQRFENFKKAYTLLDKYSNQTISTELERAGMIQFFEMTFELSWKVLKDFLEAQGYMVKSPREAIKQAYQIGVIDNGHIWLDALSSRNLITHTYDEVLAEKLVIEIKQKYFPVLKEMYERLSEE